MRRGDGNRKQHSSARFRGAAQLRDVTIDGRRAVPDAGGAGEVR